MTFGPKVISKTLQNGNLPDHKYAGTELHQLWKLVKSSTSAMESSVKTILQTFSQDPNLLEEAKQALGAPVFENERNAHPDQEIHGILEENEPESTTTKNTIKSLEEGVRLLVSKV
jgi:hypothetical protein